MWGKQATVGVSVAALAMGLLPLAGPAQAGRLYTTKTVSDQIVRWNPCQNAITYKVNVRKAGKKEARRKAKKEIKRAFRKLSKATGMRFVYKGHTKRVPTGGKWYTKQGARAEVIVAYVKQNRAKHRTTLLSKGAWGTGGMVYSLWGDPRQLAIGRGFVVVDSAKVRKLRTGFKAGPTRGNLILHELGHVVGLGHAKSKKQLMYPVLSKRTPAGFASGDRVGLAKVGASAGCIDVPSYVFKGS